MNEFGNVYMEILRSSTLWSSIGHFYSIDGKHNLTSKISTAVELIWITMKIVNFLRLACAFT